MRGNYFDENGYERGEPKHSNLVHRQIAYKEIYLPNKHKYSLPFSKYDVHHKDGDKLNNDISNLQILTRKEHEQIHNPNRRKNPTEAVIFLAVAILLITIGSILQSTLLFVLFLLWLIGAFIYAKMPRKKS